VKRLPAAADMRKFGTPWMSVHGLEGPVVRPEDTVILRHLGESNPLLDIGGFTEKVTAVIEADREWKAPLTGGSTFLITVVVRDRDKGVESATKTTNRVVAERFRERLKDQLLLYGDVQIPTGPQEQGKVFSGFRRVGYRGATPSTVYAVNVALAYRMSRVETPTGQARNEVHQRVRDLILFTIRPITDEEGTDR